MGGPNNCEKPCTLEITGYIGEYNHQDVGGELTAHVKDTGGNYRQIMFNDPQPFQERGILVKGMRFKYQGQQSSSGKEADVTVELMDTDPQPVDTAIIETLMGLNAIQEVQRDT